MFHLFNNLVIDLEITLGVHLKILLVRDVAVKAAMGFGVSTSVQFFKFSKLLFEFLQMLLAPCSITSSLSEIADMVLGQRFFSCA